MGLARKSHFHIRSCFASQFRYTRCLNHTAIENDVLDLCIVADVRISLTIDFRPPAACRVETFVCHELRAPIKRRRSQKQRR